MGRERHIIGGDGLVVDLEGYFFGVSLDDFPGLVLNAALEEFPEERSRSGSRGLEKVLEFFGVLKALRFLLFEGTKVVLDELENR